MIVDFDIYIRHIKDYFNKIGYCGRLYFVIDIAESNIEQYPYFKLKYGGSFLDLYFQEISFCHKTIHHKSTETFTRTFKKKCFFVLSGYYLLKIRINFFPLFALRVKERNHKNYAISKAFNLEDLLNSLTNWKWYWVIQLFFLCRIFTIRV